MVGVRRHPDRGELGVDPGATRLGVLVLLEDHDTGPLGHDEPVAARVIGPDAASMSSLRVESACICANPGEWVYRGFGPARDDDVGATSLIMSKPVPIDSAPEAHAETVVWALLGLPAGARRCPPRCSA